MRALSRLRYDGPLEAIVVVDGSQDGTADALGAITLPFPFRVIVQPNGGAASARNRGAQAASGDILLFLDDDMMADPAMVEQHARSHRDGADAVLGDIPLDPASPPSLLSRCVGEWAADRRRRLIDTGELTLFDLLTGQLSIRRSVFETIGGFDGTFTQGGSFGNEDLDIGVRLLERFEVVFNAAAISHQRYVVSHRAHLRQWFQAGMADVAFARKHPQRAKALFKLHGASKRVTRRVWMPLAWVPGLAAGAGWLACALIERPARSNGGRRVGIERAFLMARDLLYWRGVHLAGGIPRDRPLLVLCYHSISDRPGDPVLAQYSIPPEEFARQTDSLLRRGYRFIGGDEFAAYLRGEAGLPRRPVMLTFDDCYADLLSDAAPLLRARGLPGLAFAVTGLATNTNEWDHRNGRTRIDLLDDKGLRAAAGAGFEIGAHSRTHRPMTQLGSSELAQETSGSADDVAALGLQRPRYFAYPYGEVNRRAREAVRKAGFSAGFALTPRRFRPDDDPAAVPRVEILRNDRGVRFLLKTALPAIAVGLPQRTSFWSDQWS